MSDEYIWARRAGESDPAYEAFRSYMRIRNTPKVAEQLGKHYSLIARWSVDHAWVSRAAAYDTFLAQAETDGVVHKLAASKDKNLALMDKLREHLDRRLDVFIAKNDDPTIRWTQALTAMAKVEANWLLLKDETKTDARIGRIEELVERALREDVK